MPNSGFASLIDVNLNFHKGVKGWGSLTIIDFEQIMCFHYGGNGRGGEEIIRAWIGVNSKIKRLYSIGK